MTTLRKEPTTAEPSKTRITGIRMAQTRGGKKFWRGWSESTKGCACVSGHENAKSTCGRGRGGGKSKKELTYHEQSPEGVVEKDERGSHKHGDAYEFVKLCE